MSNVVLPSDIAAESGVIASLIENPGLLLQYEQLKAGHFHNKELACMYWAINQMFKYDRVTEIDAFGLTVKINSEKGAKSLVEGAGGESFIDRLVENAPIIARQTTEGYVSIAKTVVNYGFRRKLYQQLEKNKHMVLNESLSLGEINETITSSIDALAEQYMFSDNLVMFKDRVDNIEREMQEDRDRSSDGIIGMPTCWDLLSKYVRYEDGDLYLIAGRRKKGKSLILLTEALEKAKLGLRVVMLSTEMDDKKEFPRMQSILSGVPIDLIKSGRITPEQRAKLDEANLILKSGNFTREYDTNWTREKVRTILKSIEHKMGGIDFIVYDYMKDMESSGSAEKSSELGKWTNFLKNDIAGGYSVPVLAGVQIGRSLMIADSDNIERYATVGILWRDKSREEIIDDGVECGNYRMSIMFSRDGGMEDEDDYIDFHLSHEIDVTDLRIRLANKQHEEKFPSFLMPEPEN